MSSLQKMVERKGNERTEIHTKWGKNADLKWLDSIDHRSPIASLFAGARLLHRGMLFLGTLAKEVNYRVVIIVDSTSRTLLLIPRRRRHRLPLQLVPTHAFRMLHFHIRRRRLRRTSRWTTAAPDRFRGQGQLWWYNCVGPTPGHPEVTVICAARAFFQAAASAAATMYRTGNRRGGGATFEGNRFVFAHRGREERVEPCRLCRLLPVKETSSLC